MWLLSRGGKIGPARWASPIHPELGPGWAIKLLARKKLSKIWPSPIWLGSVWPTRPGSPEYFFPSKGYLARPTRFLGQAGPLKFWPEKTGQILAQPSPARLIANSTPQGTPDALGPGSATSTSIKEKSQLEPGPCGGPFPQNAAKKS